MVSAANEGGRQGPSLRPLHQGLPSQVRRVHVDPGRRETDLREAGQWSDDQDEGREGPSGEFNVNLFASAIFLSQVDTDNRYVVPHTPFFLAKYRSHINVEVVSKLHVVKYIYKYIFKVSFSLSDF